MKNQILTKAIELMEIYDLSKGAYARDAKGEECDVYAPEACSFCTLGILGRAAQEVSGQRLGNLYEDVTYIKATNLIQHALPRFSIAMFNDKPETTKQDVIDVLRKANESSIS